MSGFSIFYATNSSFILLVITITLPHRDKIDYYDHFFWYPYTFIACKHSDLVSK